MNDDTLRFDLDDLLLSSNEWLSTELQQTLGPTVANGITNQSWKKPPNSEYMDRFIGRVMSLLSDSDKFGENVNLPQNPLQNVGLQWLILHVYGKRWFVKHYVDRIYPSFKI